VIAVALFQGLVELVIAANYGMAVAGITVLALLLFHVAAPGTEAITVIIGSCLADTVIGVVLALVLCQALWPGATLRRLPGAQALTLQAISQVLAKPGRSGRTRSCWLRALQGTLAVLRAVHADANGRRWPGGPERGRRVAGLGRNRDRGPDLSGDGLAANWEDFGKTLIRTAGMRAPSDARSWRRRDDVNGREVRPVPPDIAGEEPVTSNGGMRADVEVRHRRSIITTAAPVADERLSRREARHVRQRLTFVVAGRKQFLKLLKPLVADRDLGVDEGVDHHPPSVHRRRDLRC
jgi:hypothetical protein